MAVEYRQQTFCVSCQGSMPNPEDVHNLCFLHLQQWNKRNNKRADVSFRTG